MQLKDLKTLLIKMGLPETEAEKQLGLLIVLVNKKIQNLEPEEAFLVIERVAKGYLMSLASALPTSKQIYFEQEIQALSFRG